MTWRRGYGNALPNPDSLASLPRLTTLGASTDRRRLVVSERLRAAEQDRPAREPLLSSRGAAQLYFCSSAGGMSPVFLIVANAPGDERYWISNLAAAGSFAPEATPAENTVTF
jgi:hypothetical protein